MIQNYKDNYYANTPKPQGSATTKDIASELILVQQQEVHLSTSINPLLCFCACRHVQRACLAGSVAFFVRLWLWFPFRCCSPTSMPHSKSGASGIDTNYS